MEMNSDGLCFCFYKKVKTESVTFFFTFFELRMRGCAVVSCGRVVVSVVFLTLSFQYELSDYTD
jgi:hypothetical protein